MKDEDKITTAEMKVAVELTAADRAFPPHDYFYHGLTSECGICGHPARLARLTDIERPNSDLDVCLACLTENTAPELDGLTVMMRCTECVNTIPAALLSPDERKSQ